MVTIDGPRPSQPNIFDPNCGSRRVLALIADRWTAIVVYALARGTMRFGQLRREIGLSQKMLTETLRDMERNGLVRRRVYAVVPPKVEYTLTPLGETLIEPLTAICRWSEQYLPQVDAARAHPMEGEPTDE
ncbi:MAG: winged helix-turn-helix transcriptional regulator [Thermomicrobiales bacterium]